MSVSTDIIMLQFVIILTGPALQLMQIWTLSHSVHIFQGKVVFLIHFKGHLSVIMHLLHALIYLFIC